MGTAANFSVHESRVRDHFDAAASLYVDKELACYRQSVSQRLKLLREHGAAGSDGNLEVLDIGCGGGLFLDLLLEEFPHAHATGLDFSESMLRMNTPAQRKRLVRGDALNLPEHLGQFDAICLDTIMHHLVSPAGYQATIDRIRDFLNSLDRFLAPGGVVLIREIYHEYRGVRPLGSFLIFSLSSLHVPGFVEKSMKCAGIQTANAGVCFLTREQWRRVFASAGYRISTAENHAWPGQPYRKFGFAESGDVHYLLRRARPMA
jgi:SAM-dependent methyltransferase